MADRPQIFPADPADGLRRAGLFLLGALPIVLVLGALLWGLDGAQLVVGVPAAWAAVAAPVLIAVVHTRNRMTRGARTAFDAAGLVRCGHYAAGALVGFFAFGYLGVLVAVPLLIAAGGTFALAWVRPEGNEAILTRLIGAVVPFLLFIAGLNIDERPVIGGVLIAMSVSALLRLWLIRRATAAPPRD